MPKGRCTFPLSSLALTRSGDKGNHVNIGVLLHLSFWQCSCLFACLLACSLACTLACLCACSLACVLSCLLCSYLYVHTYLLCYLLKLSVTYFFLYCSFFYVSSAAVSIMSMEAESYFEFCTVVCSPQV